MKTNLSLARVHGILKKKITITKINAKWIPYLLCDEQKRVHIEYAKKILKLYVKYTKKTFDNLVIGVETILC